MRARFSPGGRTPSTVRIGSFQGSYSRRTTSSQVGEGNGGVGGRRDSTRRRCAEGSEQTTSMTNRRAAHSSASSRHIRRAGSTPLTASMTASRGRRRCSRAMSRAARYAARPVSNERVQPGFHQRGLDGVDPKPDGVEPRHQVTRERRFSRSREAGHHDEPGPPAPASGSTWAGHSRASSQVLLESGGGMGRPSRDRRRGITLAGSGPPLRAPLRAPFRDGLGSPRSPNDSSV